LGGSHYSTSFTSLNAIPFGVGANHSLIVPCVWSEPRLFLGGCGDARARMLDVVGG
jgi:hypothetical protein